MDRRQFLAAGTALTATAIAGCTGFSHGSDANLGVARAPTASLEMDAVTDTGIARRATWNPPATSSDRHEVVEQAVENGTATVRDTEPQLPEGEPFVYDGAVYQLSYEVVDSEPATSFQFVLDPAENVDSDETIRYDELPVVDREQLASRGLDEPGFLGFGSSLLYLDDEIPESKLVPEPEFPVIVWDADTRGRFGVGDAYDSALHTYRFAAEQIDPSAIDYGRRLREEYGFDLPELSDDEREILREAIGEGYTVPPDESPPKALETLAERFRTPRPIRGKTDDSPSIHGTYLVRYDGDVYWTRILVAESAFTTATEG